MENIPTYILLIVKTYELQIVVNVSFISLQDINYYRYVH